MLIPLLGLAELLSVAAFVLGYFFHIPALMLVGGILVVLDDVREVGVGLLNPVFPVLLAVVLALLFQPWYVGVFWGSAAFKLFNIPTFRRNVFAFRRRYAPAR